MVSLIRWAKPPAAAARSQGSRGAKAGWQRARGQGHERKVFREGEREGEGEGGNGGQVSLSVDLAAYCPSPL